MSTIVWENLPDGVQPCPQGCGGLTEDPYGGPCRACWDAVPMLGDTETRPPYEPYDDDPDDWEPARPIEDVPTRGLL